MNESDNMDPLFQAIIDFCWNHQKQIQLVNSRCSILSADYSSYVGVIGNGRITRGSVKPKPTGNRSWC